MEFTPQEFNLMMKGLSLLPYKDSAQLIEKITKHFSKKTESAKSDKQESDGGKK